MVLIRDFVNYTHSALKMILEPAWKLMAAHLPVYTHIVCYNRDPVAEPSESAISAFDEDEPGVEGMTGELIDLIATLVSTQTVHPLIRTGLPQFAGTICGYLLLPQDELTGYKQDALYFIDDPQQRQDDMVAQESVRFACTQVLESLIETFGTAATEIFLGIALEHLKTVVPVAAKKISTTMIKHTAPIVIMASKLRKAPAKKEVAAEVFDQHEPWRRHELGLYLLMILSDDLYAAHSKGLKFAHPAGIISALQNVVSRPDVLFGNPLLLGRFLSASADISQLVPKSDPFCEQILDCILRLFKSHMGAVASLSLVGCKCLVRYANLMQRLPARSWEVVAREIRATQAAEESCGEIWHTTTEALSTLFQHAGPRQMLPLLPEVLRQSLELGVARDDFLSDTTNFAERLLGHSSGQYVGSVVGVFVPFLEAAIEKYPKGMEQSAMKV